jgi:hypothetical protein
VKGAGHANNTRFVGLDVHAETIAVAVAEGRGQVRALGTIPNRPEAVRRLLGKVGKPGELRVCYEAGPTGRSRSPRGAAVCCNGLLASSLGAVHRMIRRSLVSRTEAKGSVSADRQDLAVGLVERPNVSGGSVKLACLEDRPEIELKLGSTSLRGNVQPQEFLTIK